MDERLYHVYMLASRSRARYSLRGSRNVYERYKYAAILIGKTDLRIR
jgi:hypothetical protein